jgi:FixJ family two-component response regulator
MRSILVVDDEPEILAAWGVILVDAPNGAEALDLRISPVVSIVDDDRAVRVALGSLIRSLGWQARMYESAEEFLSSGQAANTSCLISDLRMPGMSGIEMHECLRAQGHAPATIFFTAYPTPALEAKAVSNGALVLLQKPYEATAIAHWLSVALGNPSD